MIHGSLHRFRLFRCQSDPFIPFPFPDDLLVIHLPQGVHIVPEGQQPVGHPLFRPVQVFRVHAHMVPPVLHPEQVVPEQLVEHLAHFQRVHLEHPGRIAHQPGIRHAGMPLAGPLEQGIVDPRPDPFVPVLIHPQVPGQGVRRPEPDAFHIFRQAVGIVADPGHRRAAVEGLDPGGKIPADPVAFQEKHQLPVFPEFSVGGDDGFRLFLADAADLPEPFREFFQYLQGVLPELVHDPLGHGRAHSLEHSAAQHPHQAFRPPGLDGFPALGLELPAEPGMVPPDPGQPDLLSRIRRLPPVDDGNGPHFRVLAPKDTEGACVCLEDDVFDSDFDGNGFGHTPSAPSERMFPSLYHSFRFFLTVHGELRYNKKAEM